MIRITSNSIDDLNLVYRKLKGAFKVESPIKLNNQTEYELVLARHQLNTALERVLDKVLEDDELLDSEKSLFDDFMLPRFMKEANNPNSTFHCLRPLHKVWNDLSNESKYAAYDYLCKEKGIDIDDSKEEALSEENL